MRLRLWGLGVASLLLALVAAAPTAQAATEVSVNDVKSSDTAITGLLTFRSPDVVEVDPSSFTASIDGAEASATIQKSVHGMRTSVLVIDTSGSMGASGMATVRAATKAYLQEVPPDVRVGVVTFADTAGVDLPPTTDRAAVQRVVDGLEARGDTSLYAAVQSAVKTLGSDGDRSIVLLSDGADTISTNRVADRDRAIAALTSNGVRTDVIRFKTNDPDARLALSRFAAASGGSVIAAPNASSVADAFKTSARALKSQAQFSIATSARLSGVHSLRLSGVAGGEPFDVTTRVAFGPAAAAPKPSAIAPAPTPRAPALNASGFSSEAGLGAAPWIAAGALGIAIFLLAFGMLAPSLQTSRERRLASIENYVTTSIATRAERRSSRQPISNQLVDLGEKAMEGRESTAKTMVLMQRADWPFRAGEWFVLRVLAVIAAVLVAFVVLRTAWIVPVVVGAIVGFLGPTVALRQAAKRRARKFEKMLPDVLSLVSTSLSSGFGLPQALDSIARDMAEPAGKEFSRALAETRIGTDVADALERVSERMDSTAMRWTVMAIRIQREVGGNLAETLQSTARTLRERESLYGMMRSLSAEGRLSAYILIGLPIFVFLYMLVMNPSYLNLLWTTTIGLVMIVVTIILMVIGIIWMRRVVKIEV